MKKIKNMKDEECLTTFVEFLQSGRIALGTEFLLNDGVFTHQVMTITCGNLELASSPVELEVPLVPASASSLGKSTQ